MRCLRYSGSEDKKLGCSGSRDDVPGRLQEQGCDTQAPALVGRRRGVAVWAALCCRSGCSRDPGLSTDCSFPSLSSFFLITDSFPVLGREHAFLHAGRGGGGCVVNFPFF